MYRKGLHILIDSNILPYPTQQRPNIMHIEQHIILVASAFRLLYRK